MFSKARSKWKKAIAEHNRLGQMVRHLGMITKYTSEGIIVIDAEGTIHFANTAWAKMHRYKNANAVLGTKIDTFCPMPEVDTGVSALIARAKGTGPSAGEVEHIRRGGTTFTTRMRVVSLMDDQSKVSAYIMFVTDITERRRLEEKLKASTAEVKRLRSQIEQSQHRAEERKDDEDLECEIVAPTEAHEELTVEHPVCEQSEEPLSESDEEEDESELQCGQFDPEKLKAIADLAKRLA